MTDEQKSRSNYLEARRIAKGYTMYSDRIKGGRSLKVPYAPAEILDRLEALCDKVSTRVTYSDAVRGNMVIHFCNGPVTRYHFFMGDAK